MKPGPDRGAVVFDWLSVEITDQSGRYKGKDSEKPPYRRARRDDVLPMALQL